MLLSSRRTDARRRRDLPIAAVGLVVLAALAGCSSDGPGGATAGDGTEAPDPAVVADSRLPDPAVDYDSNGKAAVEVPEYIQVDANTATTAQLVATFEANGIAQPATWAAQVIDHRPYRTGDASGRAFDELRAGLADAGLGDVAVEAVVASLTA